MDGTLQDPVEVESTLAAADSPAIEETSREYLGRWNRLISSTNWEKGRIISQWREALIEAGAPAASYSDEAWSRHAGNVTPQHAGRLRRVHQRFVTVRDSYPGLYWSHFQAALDWDDAEMWLEGAVHNGWSIAQMQGQRSQTLGALVQEQVEAAAVEVDEDASDALSDCPPEGTAASANGAAVANDDVAFDAESDGDAELHDFSDAATANDEPTAVRPFENLPHLPADLRDAFDAFKLAIVHHRVAGWQEVGLEDVLATLDALRQFALAPGEA